MEYKRFYLGVKQAIPIVIGYLPIGIAYGLIAKQNGLSLTEGILMSVLVFAGASQFMGVGMLAAGAGFVEIVLATFFLNSRHILMSSSLAQFFKKTRFFPLSILAFGVTDETYALSINEFKQGQADMWSTIGINYTAYLAWVTGTAIGVFMGADLPSFLKPGFDFALLALFVGLLALQAKGEKDFIVILVASISSYIVYFNLVGVWNVLIASIIGATTGVILDIWTKELFS